jgi:hypothetical protein
MSYFRKMLGLGALLMVMSLVAFVPLALAYDTINSETVNQPGAYVGMFQTTPTGTVTIEATGEATTTTPAATVEATATSAATVEPLATTEPLTAATATVDAAGAAQATATPATTLPATGGEFTPWPMIALLVVGGLILFSGLGLALSRRSH